MFYDQTLHKKNGGHTSDNTKATGESALDSNRLLHDDALLHSASRQQAIDNVDANYCATYPRTQF